VSTAPGEGERRAQRGYVPQYDLGARVIYESLASGGLVWVGVADRSAGCFDDLVLGLQDKIIAYQVKTSRDPEAFGLDTLLFGSEALLERMLQSRARLAAQEKEQTIETIYACDDYPRTNDNLGEGETRFSSAEFLRFHQNHRETWTLADWRASSYVAFVQRIQQATGLDDADFETFWRDTTFKTGAAGRDLEGASFSAADKRRIAEIAALLPRLVADRADRDRWSLQQILDRLGWRDPFVLRHSHTFPVDALYESNAKTQGDLTAVLAKASSGYFALVGPPGSGKSTLLSAGLLPTPKAYVLRYLAFVPDESQGLGRAEALNFLHDMVKQLKRSNLSGRMVPGSDLAELRGQMGELLLQASERFRTHGMRTVLVVDGLDHVSREEKAERSFLQELPLASAVPEGVLFVLGTQKLDLSDIPPSVRDQAKEPGMPGHFCTS
jgi:hypothetical protein